MARQLKQHDTRTAATIAVAVAVAVAAILAVSCGSEPSPFSEACSAAVEDQAFAEQRWTDLFTLHAADDAAAAETPDDPALSTAHDKSLGELLGARVDMILAEAETRHYCG